MWSGKDDVSRIITRMAAVVAVLVTVSLPLGYGFTAYANLANALEFKAKVKASALEGLISAAPELWVYAENRIQGLIAREPVPLEDELVEVFDAQGTRVARSGNMPLRPLLSQRRPLFDGERIVGHIEIQASTRTELYASAFAAALGLMLGALVFIVIRVLPLRALRRVNAALVEEKDRAETTLRSISDAVIATDAHGHLLQVNPAGLALMEASEVQEVIGRQVLDFVTPEFRGAYADMLEKVAHGASRQMQYQALGLHGGLRWLETSAVPFRGYENAVHLTVSRDVTDRKLAEEKINTLAFYDQLTGLANRTLLLDRLRQAVVASVRSTHHVGLLFIDLDKFKYLNDTMGHDMGDELLMQVAQRLLACVRGGDTVARLGGDEFVVMLTNLHSNAAMAASQIEVVGGNIQDRINKPYLLKEVGYQCTSSMGATLFKGGQAEVDSLLKQTDLAMYKSKEAGGNSLHFFDPEMEIALVQRAALEHDLREALVQGEFLLHFQAQIHGDKIVGAEALVRWQHPRQGMVPPSDFIPLAEETGLILPLGLWVLETACLQLAAWADQTALSELTLAVNVSAHQFHHIDFVDQVLATLQRTGADPHKLKLELTESMLVADLDKLVGKMRALRNHGVAFSLDDFGTGYSSLSYLKHLPLDQLKIDQAFVRDICTSPNEAAIAKTIVTLGQNLGLSVIAEGVETAQQLERLTEIGCVAYQGYHFSCPLPVAEFVSLAQGWTRQARMSLDKRAAPSDASGIMCP